MARDEIYAVDRAAIAALKRQRRRLGDDPGLGIEMRIAADAVADDVLRRLRAGPGGDGENSDERQCELHATSNRQREMDGHDR